jgi:hypothetical protein
MVALRHEGKLPGGARLLVLLVLADWARQDTGLARVSFRELADLCGVHTNTVNRALDDGYRVGALALVERGKRGRASTYLCPPNPVDNSEPGDPDVRASCAQGCAQVARMESPSSAHHARTPYPRITESKESPPPAVPKGPAAGSFASRERTPYGDRIPERDRPANAAAWLATLPPDADDYDARESATLSWPHDPDMRAHALDVWASEHAR